MTEWNKVKFASDCHTCPGCKEPYCMECDKHYWKCGCYGPTEERLEYKTEDGILLARLKD